MCASATTCPSTTPPSPIECTGDKPRTRCAAEGQDCVVDNYQEEEDLRAELECLRRREEQNNIILDALSSKDDVDTYNMVAEGLLNSTMTRQAIAHQLSNKAGTSPIRQEVADDQGRSTEGSDTFGREDSRSDNCADLLCSGDDPRINVEDLQPEPVHVFRLWQLFLDRVNPLTKIIHVPTVQPLGAKLSLLRFSFLKNYDMAVLQALVLFLWSLAGRFDRYRAWMLSGIVVQIAQKAGYHRDGELISLSPFEAEMRRRIWWQIIVQDSTHAIASGLNSSMLPANWDTKEPQNLNDADLISHATEPARSHDGPTEMAFCLILHRVYKFMTEAGGYAGGMSALGEAILEQTSDRNTNANRIQAAIAIWLARLLLPNHARSKIGNIEDLF
ncbi:transcriptional regulator family: Fungal Specific TF [Purpureocillium lilacinum]|uniref:Transcriptional regulator family: Fungal Specific TF n=1 Tax=Purpureocillium lilacinum TaxID=33203 RepID=A0ABR0BEA8_PURLI|nr:transcriptional regulator family: Fungal Specific TF [Purpureocillium lilacinum]